MKLKTLIELLTLSSNLYLISKDTELMETLSGVAKKGKIGLEKMIDEYSTDEYADDEDEGTFVQKIIDKAKEAKEELDRKMEEVAINVYEKLHIAHVNEVTALKEEIENLKREVALAEARIVHLEDGTSNR